MKYKYIFFDMDGVLIDSMNFHFDSWQNALKLNGIVVSRDELIKLSGFKFEDTIRICVEKAGKKFDESLMKNIFSLKVKYFIKNFNPEVFDGVYELLDFLKANGKKLALVSGSVKEGVNKIVEKYFEGYFDLLVSANDYENGKPNPEPYILAKNFFGCDVKECLVIEDAIAGIESGVGAGMDVLAVTTTLPRDELSKATYVFKNMNEILVWFKKDDL